MNGNDAQSMPIAAAGKPPMARRFRGFLPVVVDVETGGFDSQRDALLEIGVSTVVMDDNGHLRVHETFGYHVKPFEGANIERASLEVNGIDPHHPLRPAIDERDALGRVFRELRPLIKDAGCTKAVLVGHNAHFDLGFMNAAIARSGIKRNPFHPFSVFDTATLGGAALGQTVLKRALETAGLAYDGQAAHSAQYDSERTAELFCLIINRIQGVYQQLAQINPDADSMADAELRAESNADELDA